MMDRRLMIAGLALAGTLGLSGCGPGDGPDQRGTRAAASAGAGDARAALAAAAQKLGEDSLRFEMGMGGAVSASGEADPQAGNARMSMDLGASGAGDKMELRKVGDDIYLKFGGTGKSLGGPSDKEWMHADAADFPAGSSFDMMSPDDPAGTKKMIAAMTAVERVGANGYRGSLDLAKSPTYNKNNALSGVADTLVPFTAATDDQGRLVELTLDVSALGPSAGAGKVPGGGKMKTTYSGFGTKVAVAAPPAASVREIPSELATLLKK